MVETYQQRVQNRPARQQDAQVSASPEAFGAAEARGRAIVAGGLRDIAQNLNSIGDVLTQRELLQAEDEARSGRLAFMEQLRHIRYDPTTGYLNQTGGNALNNRVAFEEAVSRARAEAARGLSPAARRLYDRMTEDVELNAREQFIRHEAAQFKTYVNENLNAETQAFANEALLSYNNPDLFRRNVAQALAAFDRYAELNGLPPAAAAHARQELVSGIYASAIQRMASETGGALNAKRFMDANIDKLTADDAAKLRTVLQPLIRQEAAAAEIRRVIEAGPTPSQRYETMRGAAEGASLGKALDVEDRVQQRISGAPMAMRAPVVMAARGIRDQEIQPRLRELLSMAAAEVYGPDARVVVYSGGQPDGPAIDPKSGRPRRVGSHRHDHGYAADVYIYVNGRRLQGDELAPIAQFWRASQFGGVGLEMRGGGIHLDLHDGSWNYADRGGRFTAGQRQALEQGERGVMPETFTTRTLREAGFDATPMNRHFIRTFGPKTGLAVLQASSGATMETVIGNEAARSKGLVGVPVGTYRRMVAEEYGAPEAPRPSGARELPDSELYAAARDKLLSADPAEREIGMEMLRQVDAIVGANDRARARDRQVAFDEAWQRGIETGNWELTPETMIRMGPELVQSFHSAARNVLTGIQYTDPVIYGDLRRMAVEEPEKFLQIDLGDLLGANKLDNRAYGELFDLQTALRNAETPEARVEALKGDLDVMSTMNKYSSVISNLLGIDPNNPRNDTERARIEELRRALLREMETAVAQKGAALTESEILHLIYRLLERTTAGGSRFSLFGGGDRTRLFEVNRPGAREPFEPVELEMLPYERIPTDIAETLTSVVAAESASRGEMLSRRETREKVTRLYHNERVLDLALQSRTTINESELEPLALQLVVDLEHDAPPGVFVDTVRDLSRAQRVIRRIGSAGGRLVDSLVGDGESTLYEDIMGDIMDGVMDGAVVTGYVVVDEHGRRRELTEAEARMYLQLLTLYDMLDARGVSIVRGAQ